MHFYHVLCVLSVRQSAYTVRHTAGSVQQSTIPFPGSIELDLMAFDRNSRPRNALPPVILCHVPRSTERYPDRNCFVTPIVAINFVAFTRYLSNNIVSLPPNKNIK